jgi:Xaa-Pro aminopeptidase
MEEHEAPKPQRTRTPDSQVFKDFMGSKWAEKTSPTTALTAMAQRAASRRQKLADSFPGETLIIPAGSAKQRSNDTDYPYRPHTAFTYLTGWGSDAVPGSILVLSDGKPATLYVLGPAGRDTDEFYANAAIGEFWTGPRPSLDDVSTTLGLEVEDLQHRPELRSFDFPVRIIREADDVLTRELDSSRSEDQAERDDDLAREVSEMRLVKDEHELSELREAVAATHRGFVDIVSALPNAVGHERGERIIEGAFHTRARLEGNDVGYGTIAASGAHACILHWVRNDGPVLPGDLLLVDAGVERDSLYTADITRTIPVSGRFSDIQRKVYEAVLAAADRAIAHIRPGVTFRSVHDEAMVAISEALDSWGFLPVSADESRQTEAGYHRRYMIHGTSHHLGLDVHDCAQARREMYMDAVLVPGMVFTVEPGLYFQPDDLSVPEKWRGIGVRIEDNIVVTDSGCVNLSADIPRTASDVEAWWDEVTGSLPGPLET